MSEGADDRHGPLRIGIIGCGEFVRSFHLPALKLASDCRLAAICEPNPSAEVRAVADAERVPIVSRLADLLARDDLDAVLISTPHSWHADQIEQCLHAGMHVLVDKPFVLDIGDALRLTELAEAMGLVGAVGFNRRIAVAYRLARDLIGDGSLGAIRHVDSLQLGYPAGGWYTDIAISGGPFVGRGAHMADIIPWLLQTGGPQSLRALSANPDGSSLDNGGWWDVTLDSISWRATILTEGLPMYDEIRVFGEDGFVAVTRPLVDLSWPPRVSSGAEAMFSWNVVHYDRQQGFRDVPPSAPRDSESLLADFALAVRGERQPMCSFRSALPSVAITCAAMQSCRAGGAPIHFRDGVAVP